jgi:hypothetical protein
MMLVCQGLVPAESGRLTRVKGAIFDFTRLTPDADLS